MGSARRRGARGIGLLLEGEVRGVPTGLLERVRWAGVIGVLAAVPTIIGAGPVAPAYATVTAVTAQNQPGLKEGAGYAGLGIGTFTGTDVASSYSATVTLGDHPPIQGVVYEYPAASG